MNVIGTGTDIVDIKRFEKAARRHGEKFVEKIFTEKEMAYARGKKAYFIHLSGKYAAKEAVKKSLPDGARIGMRWPDIEILNANDGKPYVNLYGEAKVLFKEFGLSNVLVSISHTADFAVSNALAVKNG